MQYSATFFKNVAKTNLNELPKYTTNDTFRMEENPFCRKVTNSEPLNISNCTKVLV